MFKPFTTAESEGERRSTDLQLPIVSTDAEGKIIAVNERILAILCCKRKEIIHQSIFDLIHPDVPTAILSDIQRHLAQGKFWQGIIKFLGLDDDCHWSNAALLPMTMPANPIVNAVGPTDTILPTTMPTPESDELPHIKWVLFQAPTDARQRAESIYPVLHNRIFTSAGLKNKGLQLWQKFVLLALPCLGLVLQALMRSDWPGVLLTLGALSGSVIIGWMAFADWRLLGRNLRAASNNLSCYLYQGGINETCLVQYALTQRRAESQALSVCLADLSGNLHNTLKRRGQSAAQARFSNRDQTREIHALSLAMRSILEDQHHTTGATTRAQQIIFDLQNDGIHRRTQLKRLIQVNHHQYQTLAQIQHDLGCLYQGEKTSRKISINLQDALDALGAELRSSGERQSGVTSEPTHLKALDLLETTQNLIAEIFPAIKANISLMRIIEAAIETCTQYTTQTVAFARAGDYGLQTIVSQINRVNTLMIDVANSTHHQSIIRAGASDHLRVLQENMLEAAQVNRQVNYQTEKLLTQLQELHSLSHFSLQQP